MKFLKTNKKYLEEREKTGDLDKRLRESFDRVNEKLKPSFERLKKAGDQFPCLNKKTPKPVA